MASSESESLHQCSQCRKAFTLDSKILPGLHSLCRSCFGSTDLEGQTRANSQCPVCNKSLDQLELSVDPLRHQQLESCDAWKCDVCSEDGIESPASNWCHECQKLYCTNCCRIKKNFEYKHKMPDIVRMNRSAALKAILTGQWPCGTCNKCHSPDTPGCPSKPLSVRVALPKEESENPTIDKEMDEDEMWQNDFEGQAAISQTDDPFAQCLIIEEQQWRLPGLNLCITSIYFNEKDKHVFICDFDNTAIREFTGEGDIIAKCNLIEDGIEFHPCDMCSISADVFIVVCYENKLFILERVHRRLKIKKTIKTKKLFLSVCQLDDAIFACDSDLSIYRLTVEGKISATLRERESGFGYFPRIRADPTNKQLWMTELLSPEIVCMNPKGEQIGYVETKTEIRDFCVNGHGHLYFCNLEGIFSLYTKEVFYKFKERFKKSPRIFVVEDKMFVYLRIRGKYFIKVFKMLY